MASMDDALALVPPKQPTAPDPKTDDKDLSLTRLRLMPLEDLIEYSIIPKDEDQPFIVSTFEGIAAHFTNKSKDDVDLEVITKVALQEMQLEDHLAAEVESDGEQGINLLRKIADWGIKRTVKWLIKQMWKGVFRITKWLIKKVVTNAVRGVLEWIIRPVLMAALDFIGLNPELWPFVAALGGIAGVGYFLYDKFFTPSTEGPNPQAEADKAEAADVEHTKTVAADGMRLVKSAVSSTVSAIKGQPAQRAAAPQAAGAPIEAFAPNADDTNIMAMIQRHEGVRYKPYKDSVGKWTIGVGHLIGDGSTLPPDWDREFSAAEVQNLFAADYKKHKDAAQKIPGFSSLSISAQAALIDITFNMGPTWWHKWPSFTHYMQELDVKDAALSLQDSKWYTQVGNRAVEDVSLLSVGLKPGATGSESTTVASQNISTKAAVTTPPPVRATTQQVAQAQPQAGTVIQPGGGNASNGNKTIIQGQNGELIAVNS
jgi:lysozyme